MMSYSPMEKSKTAFWASNTARMFLAESAAVLAPASTAEDAAPIAVLASARGSTLTVIPAP